MASLLAIASAACSSATAQHRGDVGEAGRAGATTNRTETKAMPLDDVHPPAPTLMNDRYIKQQVHRAATRLAEGRAGTPPDPAQLLAGLERRTTKLDLPAVVPTATAAEAIARARAATVVFGVAYKCDKCEKWHVNSASGFVIGARGEVVTNHHVIAKERLGAAVAMTADGVIHHVVEVLAGDPAEDLAVVRLDDGGLADPAWQPLALGDDAVMGTPIYVVSHPDERFFSLTEGRVSRTYLARHRETSIARVEITADFARGSSGAAVIDASGRVRGVVNNTRSIYYHKEQKPPRDLQMVLKRAVPVSSVRRMLTLR